MKQTWSLDQLILSQKKANILHLHLKMRKYLFLLHQYMRLYKYELGNYAQTAMYTYK